jgi:hypothetical protein
MSKKNELPVELIEELADALEDWVEDSEGFEPVIAEKPVEPLEPVKPSTGSYTLIEGDSWASVASKNPSKGMTKHQRAMELAAKHGNAVAGMVINVG